MKIKPSIIAIIAWMAIMILTGTARADWVDDIIDGNNVIEAEVIWPESMHSQHQNQCNPWCANQDNGGFGMIVHYKRLDKYINFAVGKFSLVNSYGNDATVEIYQPHAVDFEYSIFRFEVAIWFTTITGYTKEIKDRTCIEDDEDGGYCKTKEPIIVHVGPLPKIKLGLNPLYRYTGRFYIEYNCFPLMSTLVNYVTLSYRYGF